MELKAEQLWAIALAGIMTELNGGSHITLNSEKMSFFNKIVEKKLLKKWWGIKNRKELLETLDKMEHSGHSARLDKIKSIIVENNYEVGIETIKDKINTEELEPADGVRLFFVSENWEKFKDIHINAWDLGRNISLCRWGYSAGYLKEDEAWDSIMYYAKTIQPLYNSWDDYGYSYSTGRIFWASAFESEKLDEYISQTHEAYNNLTDESTGYWRKLEWNVKL